MRIVVGLLVAIMLGACSSTPVSSHYYILRSDAPQQSGALNFSEQFSLANVDIAPYIDQPGLLLEIAPGEVRTARYHLWAEPVREGVETFLLEEISRVGGIPLMPHAAGIAPTRINVRIDQLHGTIDGQARLAAYFWLTNDEGIVAANRFDETLPLAEDGYAALAATQKQLLEELAKRISETMAKQQ